MLASFGRRGAPPSYALHLVEYIDEADADQLEYLQKDIELTRTAVALLACVLARRMGSIGAGRICGHAKTLTEPGG